MGESTATILWGSLAGIKLETTAPYTPEQNTRAERDNRTIVKSTQTMLCQSQAPMQLWAEAINTAVYVLNMTSTKKRADTTLFECWTGRKPDYSHLRVFGSLAFEHIPKGMRKKLDKNATDACLWDMRVTLKTIGYTIKKREKYLLGEMLSSPRNVFLTRQEKSKP